MIILIIAITLGGIAAALVVRNERKNPAPDWTTEIIMRTFPVIGHIIRPKVAPFVVFFLVAAFVWAAAGVITTTIEMNEALKGATEMQRLINEYFQRHFDLVVNLEGGLSLNPADKGNWTSGAQGKGKLKGAYW